TELLMKRIALRDRPFERKMSYEYMMRLNSTYEDFFSYPDNYRGLKLMKIDTNNLDFVGKKEDFDYIVNRIYKEDE
ncbi:MAG: deoxynucleoside kinase, partial [Candidatus Caldatribacteriota bacterium]|nr:deoxynucleoside kinase [Candidatus Caldatribacteriota bacterium]